MAKSSHNGYQSTKHSLRKANEFPSRKDEGLQISPPLEIVATEYRLQNPELFVVDKIGDPKNLIFGALDRYATPQYFRFGVGSVIGSPSDQKIDRTSSSETVLVLSDGRHGLSKKDRYLSSKLDLRGARTERVKPATDENLEIYNQTDFIFLAAPTSLKKRRLNVASGEDSTSESESTHYRSIAGKAKSRNESADQDYVCDNYTSHTSGNESPESQQLKDNVQKKKVQLSRQVDIDPANCDAWLELISYQDRLMGLGQGLLKISFTDAERKSNADVKISMYEKALAQVKDPRARETLLLGMMNEASKVWKGQKLSIQWKSIVQENPGYLRLWTRYLDFKQTSFSEFRYEEAQRIYLDCLETLQQARTKNVSSMAEQQTLYEIQIYIVMRMTLFIRESGFSEHAVAAWQALLEYQFFRPIHFESDEHRAGSSSHQETLSSFEEFWDSEVPRIGEDGAAGWANICAKQGEALGPRADAVDQLGQIENSLASWITAERTHGISSRQPARTIDDFEENDPYRVILFSDIQPFLVDSPSAADRQRLLEAFLAFSNLPPYQRQYSNCCAENWWRDGFIRNEMLYSDPRALFPLRAVDSAQVHRDKKISSQQSLPGDSPFGSPMPYYKVGSENLFASPGSWFSAFNTWQNEYAEDHGPVETIWVLRVLKTLTTIGIGGDELAEYYLALELHRSPGTVKKTARGMLKRRPASLFLYNAYALIEYRTGNSNQGEKVLITSINMSRDLDPVAQRESILLWRTLLWELLCVGKSEEAFNRLLAFGERSIQLSSSDELQKQPANPSSVLRTESVSIQYPLVGNAKRGQALTATRDHLISLNLHDKAALTMECLILLAYLRNSSSLAAANRAFKLNEAFLLKSPNPNTSTQEYLHQSFARLLYHHATYTHFFKPADLRSILTESVSLFPQNTIFLSLYAWNETRFRIDDRVRSIVKDAVLGAGPDAKGKESVTSHFFAIHAELNRGVIFGSNTNAIRGTFERAVVSECGAHCAGLWKMFFLFELSRGDMQAAKSVFYRGIRACPWVKELYMLAFDYLSGEGGMREADLRGIYELMGEKELRMHVALEDPEDPHDG